MRKKKAEEKRGRKRWCKERGREQEKSIPDCFLPGQPHTPRAGKDDLKPGVLRRRPGLPQLAHLCSVQSGSRALCMLARQAVYQLNYGNRPTSCVFSVSSLSYLSDQLENIYQENNLRVINIFQIRMKCLKHFSLFYWHLKILW